VKTSKLRLSTPEELVPPLPKSATRDLGRLQLQFNELSVAESSTNVIIIENREPKLLGWRFVPERFHGRRLTLGEIAGASLMTDSKPGSLARSPSGGSGQHPKAYAFMNVLMTLRNLI